MPKAFICYNKQFRLLTVFPFDNTLQQQDCVYARVCVLYILYVNTYKHMHSVQIIFTYWIVQVLFVLYHTLQTRVRTHFHATNLHSIEHNHILFPTTHNVITINKSLHLAFVVGSTLSLKYIFLCVLKKNRSFQTETVYAMIFS